MDITIDYLTFKLNNMDYKIIWGKDHYDLESLINRFSVSGYRIVAGTLITVERVGFYVAMEKPLKSVTALENT